MAPLKIAIASLLVGLIGLTASAMENPGSSSASPHATERRPLTDGLTMQNVREKLNTVEMRTYSRRLRDLALSEAGYRYEDEQGRKRTQALPSEGYSRREIYTIERKVLERIENERSSSASPHATGRHPLTTGLAIGILRKNWNVGEMRTDSRRLRDLALSEAGYRYENEVGRKRTQALSTPGYLRREIYATERQVLERTHGGRSEQGGSEAEQPGVTEPQPLTTSLTMEDVRYVLGGHMLGSYTRRLRELALCEAGYRYKDPDGGWRQFALPAPDYLRQKIYETEMRVLNEVHGGRSEQGGAQAEGEELDWEPLGQLDGAQAEQGGAQAEQLYGAQAEGEELDWEPLMQLDVAQAEQGGAQAEGEELDWEQFGQLYGELREELDVGRVEQLVGAQAEQDGAHAEQLDDEQAETARQIYADFGEDKPIPSNPTSPRGGNSFTTDYIFLRS